MKLHLCLTALLLSSGLLAAAQPLTWDGAAGEALRNNPTLVSARLAVDGAKQGQRIASAAFWPSLGLNAGLNRSGVTPLLDGVEGMESDHSGYQGGAQASWNLFNGFGTIASRGQSAQLLEQRKAAYAQASASLLLSLRQSFNTVLYEQKNAELLKAIAARYHQDMQYQELQFKSGHTPRWTFLKAQSDEAETQWQMEQNRLNLEADRSSLAGLLGRDPSTALPELEGGIEAPEPPQDDHADWERALKAHHSVLLQRAQLESSRFALLQSQSSLYPSLNANGSYSYSGAESWGPDERQWAAGLSLNFNLFAGGGQEAAVTQARLSLEAAQKDMDSLLIQLRNSLDKAWASYRSSFKRLPVTQMAADAGKDRFETVQKLYESGRAAFLDYEQAESIYTQAQQQQLSSQLSAAQAAAQYDNARGLGFEDFRAAP